MDECEVDFDYILELVKDYFGGVLMKFCIKGIVSKNIVRLVVMKIIKLERVFRDFFGFV